MRTLVTGGAGFIGSHIVARLLADGNDVVVVDNFATGYRENVPAAAELVEGDLAEPAVMARALVRVDAVFHLGARRAVQQSVETPLETDRTNVRGTLCVLEESRRAGVRRVVYASSSSVYGGAAVLPTPETTPATPVSPYGVSKLAAEHYCRVFANLYGLETVALRFFNVFGPRQRPDAPYAAVLPLFMRSLLQGERPTVHGDGGQSRDFTYVDNVVEGLLAAATAPAAACSGQVFNLAGGERWSVAQALAMIADLMGRPSDPVHEPPRAGDLRHSHADITRAREALGWAPTVDFAEGMARTVGAFLAGAGAAPLVSEAAAVAP